MNLYSFFKATYYKLPLKNELFKILKFFYTPDFSKALYLKFKGLIKVEIGNKKYTLVNHNTALETILFWKGITSYEHYTIECWKLLSKNKKCILDIGANTGIFSIVAAEYNTKNAQIYGFEPIPRIADIYVKNMQLNNISPKLIQSAVSDYSGNVTFYDMDSFDNQIGSLEQNHVRKHEHHKKLKPIPVQVISIDDFIFSKNIEYLDLIKIDVEGVENKVLKGMIKSIQKFQPSIIIEISSSETAADLNEFFNSFNHNYHFYKIDDQKGLIKKPEISKDNCLNYLVCSENDLETINCLKND